MKGQGASWLFVVFTTVLYLVAFGLALGANANRSQATVESDISTSITMCRYSKDIATGLGVGAFLFLLMAQVLVWCVTRCLCCATSLRPGAARGFAITFFVLSWFSFMITEICLLAGATRAAYRTTKTGFNGANDLNCETLRKGVFNAGAAFTIFTLLLSEGHYLCQAKAQEQAWQPPPYGGQTVGMTPYSR